jgi:hypothetical protein
MNKATSGARRSAPRARVQYQEDGGWRTADLVFQADRAVLVASWRTTRDTRLPYVCFDLEHELLELTDEANRLYRYHGKLLKPYNTSSVWALLHAGHG